MNNYILVDNVPVAEPDIIKWAMWMDVNDRTVKNTILANGIRISTVFLGMDLAFLDEETPQYFETMVFYPADWPFDRDEYETRYSTWNQALQHHEILVTVLRQYPEQNKFGNLVY